MRVASCARSNSIEIRPLSQRDRRAVARLDARLTGRERTRHWPDIFARLVARGHAPSVCLAADVGGRLVGYLIGEMRAEEFDAEPCGWIVAVAVDPAVDDKVGSALVTEACTHFRNAGVTTVRTMVRRTDVPLLSFFRSNAFVGGAYVQLETHVSQE